MLRKLLIVVLMFLVLVPAMAQESEVELECGQTRIEGAESGSSYVATCPSNCEAGTIWGTDVYTDDSDICTAAAHAGVITLEEGGTFDLYYLAGVDSHPASEQNGIESSDWGPWSLSFTFEEPVMSSTVQLECGQTSVEGAEAGSSYTVTCPSNCDAGSIWGTDVYTDDSDICTAAAHAGVISLEEGGTFDLFYVEGIEEHPASEQNGIESSEWGAWSLSFTFEESAIELAWSDNAQVLEGETGAFGLVYCPPNGDTGSIWGTGVYTDDSSVCTAAVHMDLISVEEGGYFNVSIVDGLESYESSQFNDIESGEWGSWGRSFVVTPEELEIEWTTTGQELPGPVGTSYAVVCPSQGAAASVWGTKVYTDDSSVCTAAVHSGLITFEDGGNFVMTIFDGLDSYEASEANDIESSEWGEWERSFFVGL